MAGEGGCDPSYDVRHTHLPQGISNVALVSIALGFDNTASQQFLEAKRNYIPTEEKPDRYIMGSCDAAHMILINSNDANASSDESKGTSSSSSDDDDEDSFDDDDDDYMYSDSS